MNRVATPALALVLIASLAGCGGAVPRRPTAALPPPTPAGEACGGQIEDAAPGNHDRFGFEDEGGLHGFRDGRGAVVIPPRYSFAYEFGAGGVAAVVEAPTTVAGSVRFGFIDPGGRWLADAYAFDNGPDYFQEGLARIVDGAGRVGFLDRGGAVVIAPQFVDAAGFCHGAATVHDGREQWTIDRAGQAIGPRAPYVPTADPCAAD